MTKIRSRNASRIQDRRGQGGGGMGGLNFPGLGGGSGGGLPFPTKAGGGLLGIVVMLAALFLPKLLGGASQAVDTGSGGGTPATEESCTSDLEQTICGANEDVQDFWIREFPSGFGQEYQETDLVFFSGATNTGCGQASSQVGPFYCPLDNLVYFDLDFLVQLQEQFGATGDLASQYIVAHEFGHHVQNLVGTSDQVRQQQTANPDAANRLSVALELQADCYAGVWANDANSRDQFEDGEVTNEAINAAEAVGDDRIQERTQGRTDPESWTHGSAEQRASWFRRGFESGDPARCNTFDE